MSIERLARGRRTLGTFKTKREAEQAERDALSARDRGSDVVPSRLTVGALFELFMKDAEARALSGTTLHGYRQIWKRCDRVASLPLLKLKPIPLSELYSELARAGWSGGKGPLSTRSIGHTHALISTVLAWGVRLEIVHRNVAEAVEPPKSAKKRAPYERADAERLVAEAAKTRYGPLVVFGFETGLRRGEAGLN